MPDPYAIATFRFEMIAPLIDPTLSRAERKRALRERAAHPVRWPSGEERPVPKSSLYRWQAAYRREGFEGLLPKRRKDRGKGRTERSAWVDKAIHLLLERPSRSLTLLLEILRTHFPDLRMTRSTLHREMKRHPAYAVIVRQRNKERRRRRRFQAEAPHLIWHLDAKGSFAVRLQDGRVERRTVLSVLDDHSRAILSVAVSATEHLGAAARCFRRAAARWGLPHKIYCDRHSVYDSAAFRTGLAVLGVHRIATRAKNAPAHGKIEAYHRILEKWFVKELPHQVVVDERHLEELLVALIDLVYQKHRHRGLKAPPEEALGGRRSSRQASAEDLRRAFWVHKRLKAHPKTGEVSLPGGLFLVPTPYAGHRVHLRYDPAEPERVVLLTEGGKEIPLEPAFPKRPPRADRPDTVRAPGSLQRLLDLWRGRPLPQAPPGYGLPEVFDAFAAALDRRVPATEREAQAIQAFYRGRGPFEREAFEAALQKATAALGPDRPVQTLLDYLARLVSPPAPPPNEEEDP